VSLLSLYDRIEVILGLGVVLVICAMLLMFTVSGGYKNIGKTTNFISGLITFGVTGTISLVVTLIAIFGGGGVLIYLILKAVK